MSYETILIDYINTLERNNTVRPLILGGTSAINGGEGGPPGGFIGYLPQWKVAYDLTEAATLVTVASGESLLDNLNHIRYRIGYLETTLSGGVGIEEAPIDGTPYVREDANWVGIDYEPADITIVKTGQVNWIDLTDGGSTTLHTHSYEPIDATIVRTGQVNWIDLTDGGETTLHTHVGISGGGGIEEAPITGKQYGREDADWTEIIVIEEAPIDTLTYGRKDAGWIAVTVSGVGIEEAPIDGTPYSRQDAGWVSASAGGGHVIQDNATPMTARANLNFIGATVTDNAGDDSTDVEIAGISSPTYPCNGRLTLETGVAISTTDQVDKTTLYFTPYIGDQVAVYNGTVWNIKTLAELSLNISAYTASKPYDIFIYDNAGTLTLEGLVWTNGTTRATTLVLQNGIYCKTGALTRRYLGTIYMDAASKCQDKNVQRFVWNYYNKVSKLLYSYEGSSHVYNGALRKWNNSDTNNKTEYIVGVVEEPMNYTVNVSVLTSAASYGAVALYVNGAIIPASIDPAYAGTTNDTGTHYTGKTHRVMVTLGYSIVQVYETSNADATFAAQTQNHIYNG